MSDNVLMDAVRKIEEDMNKLLLEVKKKRQAINVLYESMGEQPPYEIEGEESINRVIRPDQFYGKPFSTAVAEYLEMRKQACSAIEITDGLKKGGFDSPWKPDDFLRMVAISLSKNSQLFHRLPNNTFGLLAWYPDKKSGKESRASKLLKKAENPGGSGSEGEVSNQTEPSSDAQK